MPASIPLMPNERRTYGSWPPEQTMIAGPGAVTALSEEVKRLAGGRVFLVTTASLVREARLLDLVREQLGGRIVGEFSECVPHTPRRVVLAAAAQVREASPDLLVSFGGSTVTDTAKSVSYAISNDIRDIEQFDTVDPAARPTAALTPQIALPTTLSGAEYSSGVGVTDEATRTKRVFMQPGLAPATVILDVELTSATPERLWSSTGVKCMSDSIEMMYSPTSHPFVQVLVSKAVELYATRLPLSYTEDPDTRAEARAACLHATWMSARSLANSTSRLGIGAAVRHQLGPMGVPHGEATCVMLPHLVAYNWPFLAGARADIAVAFGVAENAEAEQIADRLKQFVSSLGLPTTLREVGVTEDDVPGLATRMMHDPAIAANPRPASQDDLETLLRNAY